MEKNCMEYRVKRLSHPLVASVCVPGSKSVTNRALLMAALSDGVTKLEGVLFSDDSRHFLGSLVSLGFDVDIDETNKKVTVNGCSGQIPLKNAEINVGSAGTAARFLTAMLGLSDGEYTINASEQMKARPMKPLFDALTELGARFDYLENEGCLPVKVYGRLLHKNIITAPNTSAVNVHVDISHSTQFLSALMMTGCMIKDGLNIIITSEKTTGAYVKITSAMMKDFGCQVNYDGHDYNVPSGQSYNSGVYDIEPDISAACYFWAMAAVTCGSVKVEGVRPGMMQGDMKFLEVLSRMGCEVATTDDGVIVNGPISGKLKAVDVNMNDFSDQTMTLAAIAPFADGTTYIHGIDHIRLQESDRIAGILMNLNALGVKAGEIDDGSGIYIEGGKVSPASIKTFDDHRMAMAFAVTGLMCDGVVIEDPMCCRKTFENYFDVLDKICNK